MKTFNQYNKYIIEVFDKPAKYKWKESDDSFWRGNFQIGKNGFEVTANLLDQDVWDVSFARTDVGLWKYDASGDGDEIKVFATVIAMIGDFVKKQKPEEIDIAASKTDTDDASRVKLYKRLISSKASKFGYKLINFDNNLRDTAYFNLKRK